MTLLTFPDIFDCAPKFALDLVLLLPSEAHEILDTVRVLLSETA